MKKLLLFLVLTLGSLTAFAQYDCTGSVDITINGVVSVPDVTGTFATGCYNDTFDNTGTGPIYGMWYTYTPASSGEITMTSVLSQNIAPFSTDTRVSIFTGTCTALTCYTANDDTSAAQYLSTITFPVAAGTTYYIQWDNYWDGAGFDFDFIFTPISCLKVYNVNPPTNITDTSATLNWEASLSSPASYDIEYGLTGFIQGTGTVINSATNSVNLSGLISGNIYDYYVRSHCDPTTFSVWTSVNHLIVAKTCPYYTGFDTADQLSGWTNSGNSAAYGLGTVASQAHSPSQFWIFNTNTTAVSNNWLYSPPFLLQQNESVAVSFWTRCLTSRSLRLTVGNNNNSAAQTTQIWANPALLATTYAEQTAPAFVAPTAGIYYFAFNDISAAAATTTMRLDTVNFTSVILGTNDFLSSNFSVYPNPATNVINFFNDANAVVSIVEMADLNGRVVKSQKINATEGQISVSDLATGMYIMKITTDQGVATKKIVKQ